MIDCRRTCAGPGEYLFCFFWRRTRKLSRRQLTSAGKNDVVVCCDAVLNTQRSIQHASPSQPLLIGQLTGRWSNPIGRLTMTRAWLRETVSLPSIEIESSEIRAEGDDCQRRVETWRNGSMTECSFEQVPLPKRSPSSQTSTLSCRVACYGSTTPRIISGPVSRQVNNLESDICCCGNATSPPARIIRYVAEG